MKHTHFLWLLVLICCSAFAGTINNSFHNKSGEGRNKKKDNLDLNLSFAGDSLFVKATYTHYFTKTDADSFYFVLNPAFAIKSIKAPGYLKHSTAFRQGRPFPFILIKLDRQQRKENFIDFQFDYVIDLVKTNHIKSGWLELNVDKFWHPIFNDIDNSFTSAVHVENFTAGYSLLSYPDIKVESKGNGIFDVINNTPGKEVYLLAGRDMKAWVNKESRIPVYVFGNKNISDSVFQSISNRVDTITAFYNEKFGYSAPIKKMTMVLRNTKRKELGFQQYRPEMVLTGTEFNDYGNFAHEIAHYWWNDADFLKEPWLNEGFANYSMLILLEQYWPREAERIIAQYKKANVKLSPVSGTALFAKDAYSVYYMKSTLLLLELDIKIGRSKMLELLAKRISKKVNDEKGLIKLLAKIVGSNIADEFERKLKND